MSKGRNVKEQLTFSHRFSKLARPDFTTVRWLDSVYILGRAYPVFLVSDNFLRSYLFDARVVRMEVVILSTLSDDFIQSDADCSRDEFYLMLEGWYHKKPDWRRWDSEVQVLTLQRCEGERIARGTAILRAEERGLGLGPSAALRSNRKM